MDKAEFPIISPKQTVLERCPTCGEATLIEVIMKGTGLSEERAYLLHLEMWVYVHGIASMLATSYLNWDMDFASRALTDAYQGLRARHIEEEKKDGSHQDGQSDQKV